MAAVVPRDYSMAAVCLSRVTRRRLTLGVLTVMLALPVAQCTCDRIYDGVNRSGLIDFHLDATAAAVPKSYKQSSSAHIAGQALRSGVTPTQRREPRIVDELGE